MHITLLRTDNGLVALLKKVRGYAGIANADGNEERAGAGEGGGEKAYGRSIAAAERPRATLASLSGSPPKMPARVQEVRRKKREQILPG